jgi:hypothetical protein
MRERLGSARMSAQKLGVESAHASVAKRCKTHLHSADRHVWIANVLAGECTAECMEAISVDAELMVDISTQT